MGNREFRNVRNVMATLAVSGLVIVLAGESWRTMAESVMATALTSGLWLGAVVIQFMLNENRLLTPRDMGSVVTAVGGVVLVVVGASSLLMALGVKHARLDAMISMIVVWVVMAPWCVISVRHWRKRSKQFLKMETIENHERR